VLAARAVQHECFQPSLKSYGSAGKGRSKVRCNAGMRTKELHKHCQLKSDAQNQFPPLSSKVDYGGQGKWRSRN